MSSHQNEVQKCVASLEIMIERLMQEIIRPCVIPKYTSLKGVTKSFTKVIKHVVHQWITFPCWAKTTRTIYVISVQNPNLGMQDKKEWNQDLNCFASSCCYRIVLCTVNYVRIWKIVLFLFRSFISVNDFFAHYFNEGQG